MPNFSSLTGLEGAEKFVAGWSCVGFQVATVSNLNPSYFKLL